MYLFLVCGLCLGWNHVAVGGRQACVGEIMSCGEDTVVFGSLSERSETPRTRLGWCVCGWFETNRCIRMMRVRFRLLMVCRLNLRNALVNCRAQQAMRREYTPRPTPPASPCTVPIPSCPPLHSYPRCGRRGAGREDAGSRKRSMHGPAESKVGGVSRGFSEKVAGGGGEGGRGRKKRGWTHTR